jgi:CheY-like chemotaxis protein
LPTHLHGGRNAGRRHRIGAPEPTGTSNTAAPRTESESVRERHRDGAGIAVASRCLVNQRARNAPGVFTTYRILIVDDDEDARILLIRALDKSALTVDVLTAGDGVRALELLEEARPHALITDVMMPRMDGFRLCAAVRADPATADIPVIVLTALESERDRQRGLSAGADSYFTKPFNWRVLTDHLAELLEARYGARAGSGA